MNLQMREISYLFLFVCSAICYTHVQTASAMKRTMEQPVTLCTGSLLESRFTNFVSVRGGADREDGSDVDEESESDAYDEELSEDENDDNLESVDLIGKAIDITKSTVLPHSKKALVFLARASKRFGIATFKALKRALVAGIEGNPRGDQGEANNSDTFFSKVAGTLGRMVKAAFTFDLENESDGAGIEGATEVKLDSADSEGEEKLSTGKATETEKTLAKSSDFGKFLAKMYGVAYNEDEESHRAQVLGGTLTNALTEARSQARLLVVYIPSSRPGKKTTDSKDTTAIQSIISKEVGQAANKRARKNGEKTGSFIFWGAKVGSSEAASALKRLRAKAASGKGEKRPVLMVIYPAMAIDSSGLPKIVPKVIAQHHCSPPPSSPLMVAWLNTLRKRHAKQYNEMQTEIKEILYYKERKEGYKESKKNDKGRQKREAEEEAKRRQAEQEEKEHKETIEKRRQELKAQLPGEATGNDVTKIAVRFADGRSGQRAFDPGQKLVAVFNWVDVFFEMERESVVLKTMNGKMTFEWNDHEKTLSSVGLGRKTGFRVLEKSEVDPTDQRRATDDEEL